MKRQLTILLSVLILNCLTANGQVDSVRLEVDSLLNTMSVKAKVGEAMASIAAVAHVQLKTNTADTDMGTNLKLEDGKITANLPYPGPAGSIVEVRNLFYNVPARRKFLKNDRI